MIWTEWESDVGACETVLLEVFRREEEIGADSDDKSDMVSNSDLARRRLG